MQLCVFTLSLLETLIDLNCEDIMLELIFKHLIPCTHVMYSQRNRIQRVDPYCRSAEKFFSFTINIPTWGTYGISKYRVARKSRFNFFFCQWKCGILDRSCRVWKFWTESVKNFHKIWRNFRQSRRNFKEKLVIWWNFETVLKKSVKFSEYVWEKIVKFEVFCENCGKIAKIERKFWKQFQTF